MSSKENQKHLLETSSLLATNVGNLEDEDSWEDVSPVNMRGPRSTHALRRGRQDTKYKDTKRQTGRREEKYLNTKNERYPENLHKGPIQRPYLLEKDRKAPRAVLGEESDTQAPIHNTFHRGTGKGAFYEKDNSTSRYTNRDNDRKKEVQTVINQNLHTNTGIDKEMSQEDALDTKIDGTISTLASKKKEKEGASILDLLVGNKNKLLSHISIRNSATRSVMEKGLLHTEEALMLTCFGDENICAKTKTGHERSFLYLIPLLNKIKEKESVLQAVVLLQNKQAALSTLEMALKFAENTGIRIIASCGGTNIYEDIVEIQEGLHVLITTPGRFLDISNRNIIHFTNEMYLVLDEADILVHSEKYGILTKIFEVINRKQVMVFSFKFNLSLRSFAEQKMQKYRFYNLLYETPRLKHFYAVVENRHKFYCLQALLSRVRMQRFIIYCNAIKTVKTLTSKLGSAAVSLHSAMSIQTKNEMMGSMSQEVKYIVCNDIYPSNCEFKDVRCVINFDSPCFSDQYFNRLVRIGKIDSVITMMTESDLRIKEDVEKKIVDKLLPVSDSAFRGFMAG